MALPFFRALNPISQYSGIEYALAAGYRCQNREMIDSSALQGIYNAFKYDYYLTTALRHTYEILVGCHYDLYFRGALTAHGGSKGILDLLIFPLIARKLLADVF